MFRRTTNLAEVHRTVRRIQAHFLEFRLFHEEPRLIWRAQKRIVAENGRFLVLIARPLLILTLPMIWLWFQLDSAYAHAPLALGQAAVVTVQFDGAAVEASLHAPPEIAVESAGVRSVPDGQISWRIRPLRPVVGELHILRGEATLEKSVAAGSRSLWLMPRRAQSWAEFLLHPEEARLPDGNVRWIEVDYPAADVSIFGLALHWMFWFVLISSLTAMILSRLTRVRL